VSARPFDVCGPLPTGVTLLEASAGTGKTYAIAALAARLVAAGAPLSELLLVTFTRMATGELRDRVRERLVSAERGLARDEVPDGDDVLALLAAASADERACSRRRLAEAVAGFDAATIVTTHGFCQHVLASLGVAGDVERDVTFVEDLSDLVEEVVDDLYVRRFVHHGGAPPISRAEALRIGRAAVDNPLARLAPEPGPDDAQRVWAMRWRLARAVREEVEHRKRRLAVMTYDDLVSRLRAALADPVTGPDACAALRARYRHVLVDEFQDTDPEQWEILQRAFGTGETTLVLIGDPKQAIYAFRGGDVFAYLEAARAASTRETLAVNWRSDRGLIDAFDRLFRGAQLGHPGIVYREVSATAGHRDSRLAGAPAPAPLRVRIVRRSTGLVPSTQGGYVPAPAARTLIADDVAADVVRLLSSTATADGEPIGPGHLAVLVRRNRDAELVRAALDRAGVPAVINGSGSVFGSPAARDWLRLLEALERPQAEARARACALTVFLGWTAEQLALADDRAWDDVHARLHRWAAVLRARGVAALFDRISTGEGLPRRVLSVADGERELTDLRHVAELLHAAAAEQERGVASLTAWLRQRMAGAERDAAHEERARRLDSDAEAVQVLTIHRSKGLEFPIVYVPFAWDPGWVDEAAPPCFHDRLDDNARTLDVGLDGPDSARHRRLRYEEERGEDLRLLYVALTRARHQAVVWWAPSAHSKDSPLGRLLFAVRDDGSVPASGRQVPSDDAVVERLAERGLEPETVARPIPARWAPEDVPQRTLEAASFTRSIDVRWGRTSYTGIVAGHYEAARVASEPDEDVRLDDEAEVAVPTGVAGTELPLAAMASGVEVGDLVHRVLQATDFAAPSLGDELELRLREQRARRDVDVGDPAAAIAGLEAALTTALGGALGELRLRDVRRRDRLDELAFELPLAGGDVPDGTLATTDVAALLETWLRDPDPLAGYAERLREPGLRRDLRGYLTGTLDLVLRADGRYTVVDYKTNWLGSAGEPLTAWHYRPAALAETMQRSHYALQALLYLVALHRYLRWRLPGYVPARDLGGAVYLFLRGMTGAATPAMDGGRCGVFAWQPPAGLVEALSDLLDRGRAAA
jgi:exodeoxyribonuclease V beta subunit